MAGYTKFDGPLHIEGDDGSLHIQKISDLTSNPTKVLVPDGQEVKKKDIRSNYIPLGRPADGHHDGLLDFNNNTMTTDAIDDINEILGFLAPPAPGNLSGNLILENTTKYNAILSSGLPASWYQDSKVAGDLIPDYVVDGVYNLLSPSPASMFKCGNVLRGDLGILHHILNEAIDSSRSLSSGGGVTGTIEILSIEVYNSIWKKATARINYTHPSEGYVSHSMRYNDTIFDRNTNPTKIWFDPSNPLPSFPSALTVTQVSFMSERYLSGLRYYSTGDTFRFQATIANIANRCIRPVNPVNVIMPGISSTDIAIAVMDYTASYSLDETLAINVVNIGSIDARGTCTARKPDNSNSNNQSPSENRLVNTYNATTNGNIHFWDELYRCPLSMDFSSIPESISGNFNSQLPLSNGNLQLYNGVWRYPNINYTSGYLPAQTADYSTFSGNQVGVWAANIGLAHSSMRITFTGMVYTAIAPYGTGNLNIEIRLPSETDWLDCGKNFGDGNGCRVGSSSGGILNLTFGTNSSSGSNGVVFIRVTLRNTSALSPTNMAIIGT